MLSLEKYKRKTGTVHNPSVHCPWQTLYLVEPLPEESRLALRLQQVELWAAGIGPHRLVC